MWKTENYERKKKLYLEKTKIKGEKKKEEIKDVKVERREKQIKWNGKLLKNEVGGN